MKKLITALIIALAGCSDSSEFPSSASAEQLEVFLSGHSAKFKNTPKEHHIRLYGMYLEQVDGAYSEQKGKSIVLPSAHDNRYSIAFYAPSTDDIYLLVDQPITLSGVRVPRVGNPRGSATCLRARNVEGDAEQYVCVAEGKVVSGVER